MDRGTIVRHPFPELIFENSSIVILGTFPSIDSFENDFYYGHRRNLFWRLLADIAKMPVDTVEEKIELLTKMRWGLWDMVASCSRRNSLDSSLRDIELNDIEAMLERHPSVKRLLFTGRKAQRLFEKGFGHLEIERDYLPSPSPAYAAMTYREKLEIYREKLLPDYRGGV
jgi:hypoxanthine-DNA glycosylase